MNIHNMENNNQENYSLHNVDNYKKEFTNSSSDIFSKYIEIISEYFINCSESIHMHNNSYYKYVIIKGMETLAHVFKMLLLYTKNLNLVYYHCQKSFYYYVEFISQIGDNNHIFLQLNSCDASLFVYKKTIYDINQEYRKKFSSCIQENMIMNNVESLIFIYNNILSEKLDDTILSEQNILELTTPLHTINKYNSDDTKMSDIKNSKKTDNRVIIVFKEANKLIQCVLSISIKLEEIHYLEKLQLVKEYFNGIIWKDNKKKKNDYFEVFVKHVKKNTIPLDKIKKKMNNEEYIHKFETLSSAQFMNWIMD